MWRTVPDRSDKITIAHPPVSLNPVRKFCLLLRQICSWTVETATCRPLVRNGDGDEYLFTHNVKILFVCDGFKESMNTMQLAYSVKNFLFYLRN